MVPPLTTSTKKQTPLGIAIESNKLKSIGALKGIGVDFSGTPVTTTSDQHNIDGTKKTKEFYPFAYAEMCQKPEVTTIMQNIGLNPDDDKGAVVTHPNGAIERYTARQIAAEYNPNILRAPRSQPSSFVSMVTDPKELNGNQRS